MKKTKFYELENLDGDKILYSDLESIQLEIENDIDSLDPEEELKYTIRVRYLTDKEIAETPKYQG